MKYYDFYDFSDEIEIMKRLYQSNKEQLKILKKENGELRTVNGDLFTQKEKMGDSVDEQIKKRKIERTIEANLNKIQGNESTINDIETKIKSAIEKVRENLKQKLDEKDDKISVNETNLMVVKKQLENCESKIAQIEENNDATMTPAIKSAMLAGLNQQKDEYKKMLDEISDKSEELLDEKLEIDNLNKKLSMNTLEQFVKAWDKVEKPVISTPTTPSSTPTTPSSTPTTPSSTPTTPSSAPTTPSSTPTTPSSAPTTPSSTPTTPSSTPTIPTVQVKVGRTVEVLHKGENVWNIGKRELQGNVKKLDDDEKIEMVESAFTNMTDDLKRKIKNKIHKFDDSILYTFSDMMDEAKKEKDKQIGKISMEAYVSMVLNNKPVKGFEIEYDKKNLSKCHFRSMPLIRLFTGEMSRKQKDYINEMAERSSDFTVSTGIYEKNPFKRYLKERKQKKLGTGDIEVSHEALNKLEGYRMAPDPDRDKTPEQIAQENARIAQRQEAYRANNTRQDDGYTR